jgi:hypothetical protein
MSLRTVTNSAPNKPLQADALQRPLRFRFRARLGGGVMRQRAIPVRRGQHPPLTNEASASDGRSLTPWFTRKKNGRLYRYYLPVRENKEHVGASGLPRPPAAELEVAPFDYWVPHPI